MSLLFHLSTNVCLCPLGKGPLIGTGKIPLATYMSKDALCRIPALR